uniref:Plastid light harvesting protein n=1 Tax=Entomoneis paludosa TaxID=265537 RepID=A0A6U3BUV1_9STRA|eukprot:CAMPEP_0172441312 /NCGR_PEP_ID=MMETSP1065-20121228/1848_1 /TAXON_ID=265537 /ORGANISM="Amphiprora paludosa, Strain CCMP125" /LENGTH=201 /DNA_ID=CAMNT_0013190581 /DNA_START=8 /DNA_END=613 /DNA_ORIENTATION=+
MMKTTALLALIGSAAAFAPLQTKSASSALADKPFSDVPGVAGPVGYWDPCKLIADGDQENFDHFRESEIKHGRIAMLAVVGYLTTAAGVRFPGAEGMPDGLKAFPALTESPEGLNVLGQMLLFVVLAERCNRNVTGEAEFPGDYRNGALDFGWDSFDDATKYKKRTIEINNGRAAMMGIWGLVTHELLGNSILPGGYLPGH